jgi:hypothetical protein
MAKIRTAQTSYVNGALDEKLLGRIDNEVYTKGALELENVYVSPQGGIFRREGLEYIDTTTSSNPGRLVGFEFNVEQTYLLVFTAGQFKVYKTDDYSTIQATVSTAPISSLTANIIAEMRWTQSADTLYIVHPDLQPIKITRTSDIAWTATSVAFENIPVFPYAGVTVTTPAGDVTPSATTGNITLTGTSTNFTAAYEGQYINMVGFGEIFVKTVNSTTELEGRVTVTLENTDAVVSGDWELESGYEPVMSATRGWPRSISFWRGRLWLGGLRSRPQTILGSKVGVFEDFDEGEGLDDESINITIDDDAVNAINDVFAGRGFQIFTSGGEFTLRSSLDSAVTPGNAFNLLQKETLHGSGAGVNAVAGTRWPRPLSVDGATIFVESAGGVARQFVFNDLEQSFNANNISILSQNIVLNPSAMAIRRATQEFPNDYVYMVNSDGTVAVLNSLREQSLLAWSKFTTDGEFEDVAVVGRKTFFIVKRTIDGNPVRYIEVLNSSNFTDSSVVTDNGSATTSWTGLDHLEAEEVRVRGDGYILNNATVSSGAITSSEEATILEAGLFFAAKVRHLPLEIVIQGQSFSGQWKSPVFANIRLYQSRNIVVLYEGKRQVPTFRNFGDTVLDQPVSNFSGWKKVYLGGVRRDVEVTITQDDPLEFNILMVHFGVRV